MAITVLEPILSLEDEPFGAWLWKLTTCRDRTRSATAQECHEHAEKAVNLLLENRARVLEGISEQLQPLGLAPNTTFTEWLNAMQKIAELSARKSDDCTWSAPAVEGIDLAQSAKAHLRWMEDYRRKRE